MAIKGSWDRRERETSLLRQLTSWKLLSTLPSGWPAGSRAPWVPGAAGALCRAENKAEDPHLSGDPGFPLQRTCAGRTGTRQTRPAAVRCWWMVAQARHQHCSGTPSDSSGPALSPLITCTVRGRSC